MDNKKGKACLAGIHWIALYIIFFAMAAPATAQNCRGFQNPTNFNPPSGSTGRWTARVGDRIVGSGGSTGNNILSTCSYPTATVISGHTNITDPQYYSGTCSYTDGTCHHTFYDAHDHRFSIYTQSANGGYDAFTVNGNNGLPRVPPGFTSSIRLGDMRSTGTAVHPNSSDPYPIGNDRGSEALFYTMQVRPQTAFVFINYAIVARRYDHTASQAGEFVIRVVGKNPTTHQWNNFPLNDSLWYCVPAPAFSSTLPAPWVEGLPGPAAGGTTCGYCYKPWTKVAINLSSYLYDSVRIEMYTSDCIYNVDPIYAYITGSCQPMTIMQQGCTSGETDIIDTLRAPEGLISYSWYVSTTAWPGGPVVPNSLTGIQFRPLGTSTTSNIHASRIADFVISEGPDQGDTAAEMLYKCVVTSALDPAKPFHTDLYTTVNYSRPNVSYRYDNQCNGTIHFHANGWIPNQNATTGPHVVDSLTTWVIHEGGPRTPVIDTLHGIDAIYTFSDASNHSVVLTMFSSDSGCFTSRTFTVAATTPPVARLEIASHSLCEGDTGVLTDQSQNIASHQWVFADTVIEGRGSGLESTRVVRRLFSEPVNPVMLIVTDAYGCADTTYDTILYFASSVIRFTPDTIVCAGQASHVEVIMPIPGCTFEWYRHHNLPGEQPFLTGRMLNVRQNDDSTTYYVKITTPAGCMAWDSVTLYRAALRLTADPPHASFCPGDTVTLTASGALSYRWKASPPDPDLDSQAQQTVIRVSPQQTTTYTLTGLAADSCSPTPVRCKVEYVPLPRLAVEYNPPVISADEPVVRFTDLSEGRSESYWLFSDSSHTWGEAVSHRFDVNGDTAVGATLTSFNKLRCPADTALTVPVRNFAFWRPNVFTPLRPENNRFSIINTYPMAVFHVYIYNRFGALVFESDDPDFAWDGTSGGVACPQGSYNYRITYIPQNDTRENIIFGTVTLLR